MCRREFFLQSSRIRFEYTCMHVKTKCANKAYLASNIVTYFIHQDNIAIINAAEKALWVKFKAMENYEFYRNVNPYSNICFCTYKRDVTLFLYSFSFFTCFISNWNNDEYKRKKKSRERSASHAPWHFAAI